MQRCQHCHGKFGLTRHRILTFKGYLNFCSRRCKDAFVLEREDFVRKKKWFKWLYDES